jgi:hypothetical protein
VTNIIEQRPLGDLHIMDFRGINDLLVSEL